MAKTKTFAEKMIKDKSNIRTCPVCGSAITAVKTMVPERNDDTGYFKFRNRMVEVCKCNHQQVYG